MTKEEAIKRLTDMHKFSGLLGIKTRDKQALSMGIDALEQEPCEDAISKEEALKNIPKIIGGQNDFADCIRDSVETVINSCNTIQPKAKVGKWIRVDKTKVKCSECDITHFIAQYPMGKINYCPNCGTKMKE